MQTIDVDNAYALIRLASVDEEAFLEVVRNDSVRIPVSVKLFPGDRIRNALTGMENDERAMRIVEALDELGI